MSAEITRWIEEGKTSLGIELGSTRIKAVLIGQNHEPIASGGYNWENRLENGIWTYRLEDVWTGLQTSYTALAQDVQQKYNVPLKTVGGIGISAMMHGYIPFDKNGSQLAEFRTWRNTTTEQAAKALTEVFSFNIPQRWSIAHLHQAVLNGEAHVANVDFLTTLSGYVHWKLTGEKVLGIGDASGMFPIDSTTNNYDEAMLALYAGLMQEKGYAWTLPGILPKVQVAGDDAGHLTAEGAKLLDPTGVLPAGIAMCPPEGDAGTGMVATNSIDKNTGNVSAGTSIFAMVVLEKMLSKVYPEIDMVTTPAGRPVAMAHANNCTGDLDAWVGIFQQVLDLSGASISKPALYDALYNEALKGDPDCGGLLSYNYYSGEPVTALEEGRPLFVRTPNANFNLPNFMRNILFSAMATLKIAMDTLTEKEHVTLAQIMGHGGLFKTKGVGQQLMAAALNVPVAVMESAGEGGAWGIALLAAYTVNKQNNEALEDYLNKHVFATAKLDRVQPVAADVEGFAGYMARYKSGLTVQRAATEHL